MEIQRFEKMKNVEYLEFSLANAMKEMKKYSRG